MARWEVEYTDEFGDWWDRLTEAEQESIDAIGRSKHPHMRELRIGPAL